MCAHGRGSSGAPPSPRTRGRGDLVSKRRWQRRLLTLPQSASLHQRPPWRHTRWPSARPPSPPSWPPSPLPPPPSPPRGRRRPTRRPPRMWLPRRRRRLLLPACLARAGRRHVRLWRPRLCDGDGGRRVGRRRRHRRSPQCGRTTSGRSRHRRRRGRPPPRRRPRPASDGRRPPPPPVFHAHPCARDGRLAVLETAALERGGGGRVACEERRRFVRGQLRRASNVACESRLSQPEAAPLPACNLGLPARHCSIGCRSSDRRSTGCSEALQAPAAHVSHRALSRPHATPPWMGAKGANVSWEGVTG